MNPLNPDWMINGLKDLGFHETGDNHGIEKFITQAHTGAVGQPWCAIWANAKLEQSGIAGTRSPSSQSFRHSDLFIKLAAPAYGAIAVYWRNGQHSGLGHVGFYMGETATQVLTLGGNESDAVRKQFESKGNSKSSSGLWGYWWPKSVQLPDPKPIRVSSAGAVIGGKVT